MLDRIKKKQADGFKEFVSSMETTGSPMRGQILTAGLMEDPIYMTYVMKNLKTFNDFLQLSSDDILKVMMSQKQMVGLFAKCIFGTASDPVKNFESSLPALVSKLKDELSYIKDVSAREKEGAAFFILETTRKFQLEDKILGFPWIMPPQEIYRPLKVVEGYNIILFDNGVVAAEGSCSKGKRNGKWKHYYETGKLLAEGEYFNDLKTGIWHFFYSNEQPKAQGSFRSDLKQGTWKEWDRTGQLNQVVFSDGVKVNQSSN
jgi:hypothetical protein